MVRSTLLARVVDGLPLAASMDDEESDLTEYKNQAKLLFKKLHQSEQRCSFDSPPYVFQYCV
jgi:vesicle transport protein SEC22